jgi:hypothetical protein
MRHVDFADIGVMSILEPISRHVPGQMMRRRRRQRRELALSYIRPMLEQIEAWLAQSRETTNFTYDLQPLNLRYLAAFLTHVTGQSYERCNACLGELLGDRELAEHLAGVTAASPRRDISDSTARYGRRVGWYALVRLMHPKVVVETGVDKGLGSCVLCAALRRNAAEGHPGRYYGTDISPTAGWLLRPPYSEFGRILVGDSIASLTQLNETIDLFINDSDHSAEYEGREYQTIAPKLGAHGVILGDNSHCSEELLEFARATGRRFLFFQEKPQDHWYPGAGIGAAF